MKNGQLKLLRGIGNGEREHRGVLVVYAVEVDSFVGLEGRQTEPFPVH